MDVAQYMNNQTMANLIKRSYDVNEPNVLNPKYMGFKIGTHIIEKPEGYFPQHQSAYQKYMAELNKKNNQGIVPDRDPYYRNMRDVHEYITRTGRFSNYQDVISSQISAKSIVDHIINQPGVTPTVVKEYLISQLSRANQLPDPQERSEKLKQLKLVSALCLSGGLWEICGKKIDIVMKQ